MSKEQNNNTLVNTNTPSTPTTINLSPTSALDISFLSDEERKALLMDHTKGMLDISRKAQELNVDSMALKNTLDDLSASTREVSEGGDAVTITHSQTTSVGRTEVMMGNTEQAKSGKFTKSQTGEKDMTPYYVFGGIIALIVIISLMNS